MYYGNLKVGLVVNRGVFSYEPQRPQFDTITMCKPTLSNLHVSVHKWHMGYMLLLKKIWHQIIPSKASS